VKKVLFVALFSIVTVMLCWGQACYDPATAIWFTEPENININPYLYDQIWQKDIDQICKNFGFEKIHLLPKKAQVRLRIS
jgi:hypothetical protein